MWYLGGMTTTYEAIAESPMGFSKFALSPWNHLVQRG